MIERGPRFTEAARLAAAQKRRERASVAAAQFNLPAVFLVRAAMPQQAFSWEIRKFGGVTLARSHAAFQDSAEALRAGSVALKAYRGTPAL